MQKTYNIHTDVLALLVLLQDCARKCKNSYKFSFAQVPSKRGKKWMVCLWLYALCHVHFWQEGPSMLIRDWWEPNSPCILFCMSDNWKNFLQTSFWLCKFQALSLLHHPPMSGARHWGTLCYQFMVSGSEPSCFATIVGELAEWVMRVFLAALPTLG